MNQVLRYLKQPPQPMKEGLFLFLFHKGKNPNSERRRPQRWWVAEPEVQPKSVCSKPRALSNTATQVQSEPFGHQKVMSLLETESALTGTMVSFFRKKRSALPNSPTFPWNPAHFRYIAITQQQPNGQRLNEHVLTALVYTLKPIGTNNKTKA